MTEEQAAVRVRLRAELAAALAALDQHHGGPRLLARCSSRDGWPEHGVALLAEPDTAGRAVGGAVPPRITMVGSHGLEPGSPVLLWTRLAQHRGSVAGPNPGAGNHRGSRLRMLVGEALQARDGAWPEAAASWGQGERADRAQRRAEAGLERAVSAVVGAMPVRWFAVPDREERIRTVRALVGLLSAGTAGPDAPAGWLGAHSPRDEVRRSGLWHVDGLDAPLDVDAVEQALGRIRAAPAAG